MKKLTDYIAEAEQTLSEKAVSQQQQKFMGMVHAMQRGKKIKGASIGLKKAARTMGKKDAKDFASTKHTGLPKKVSEQRMAEGVAESMPMGDAVKVLRHYGADHFKTTSNELHFYKNGRPFSVDLIWSDDATRSVNLSQLNSATRSLKGQGISEATGRSYDLELEIINPAYEAWENGAGDEQNPPDEVIDVGVDYNISGSYKSSTWGYHGGSPEEHPELDEYKVYDLATGQEINNLGKRAQEDIEEAIWKAAENSRDDDDGYYDSARYEGLGEGMADYEDDKKYVVDAETGRVVDGPFDRVSEIPLRLMGFDGAHKIKTGAELSSHSTTEAVSEGIDLDHGKATFDHICKTFSHECKRFRESNGKDLDRDLFNALYDYYFDDMPYGIKKDRDGDSFEWVRNRCRDDLGLGQVATMPGPVGGGDLDVLRKMAGLPSRI